MKKILLTLLIGIFFLTIPIGSCCTVFHASNDSLAIGGNNEDWSDPDTYIYFIPGDDPGYHLSRFRVMAAACDGSACLGE